MTDIPPPSKRPAEDPRAERLAKALRENLRRRKAPPPSSDDDVEAPPESENAS